MLTGLKIGAVDGVHIVTYNFDHRGAGSDKDVRTLSIIWDMVIYIQKQQIF